MVAYGRTYPARMTERLRVATFNVHHCEGLDGRVDVARVAAVIRATGAELVALQELDRGLPRSGRADQPALLAAELGMHFEFRPTITRGLGDYGIALATSEPTEVEHVPLPRVGDEEPRAVLRATYRAVRVLATHLSRDRAARAAQLQALAELAANDEAVVVLGDLNERPGSLGALESIGLAGCRDLPTLPAGHPRRQIDHILAAGGLTIEGCRTIPTDASDHRPLVADLVRRAQSPATGN